MCYDPLRLSLMFRRFVTRCTSVYVLSIHTLCSHSLNEYTTVLEVWDFPFLLPQPTTSILFSTPSPISGDESSRVGSYPTPLTPLHRGRGVWDRTAPRTKRHLRWTEPRGRHAPTTHLIEIINGGSHRHSTAKSIITSHPRTHSPLSC